MRKINAMNLLRICFLLHPKSFGSQTGEHKPIDYFTHIEISCQCGRETASYITVLSIIPLR